MSRLEEQRLELELPEDFETPPGSSPVASYDSPDAAHEAGLAILAMGQPYWLLPYEGKFFVFVASKKADLVARELAAISHLNRRGTPASPHRFHEFPLRQDSFWIYLLILVAAFSAQQQFTLETVGRVDAGRMLASAEWWRAVTALTLHGDVVHLVSNLVSGIGFALFVARFFGAACGWCLILLAGALGNALNAWIHYPEPHFSIGASTAVFGALGIITGIGIWAALVQPKERWTMPPWLLPAFGGLTLLGLLGVGDGLTGRIDVAAHISGFFCGAWIGLLGAFRQSLFLKLQRYGLWIGAIPITTVALSWMIALLR